MTKPRQRAPIAYKALFLLSALLLGTVVVLKYLRAAPIDELADRYARELFSGNDDRIIEYIPHYELDKLGMSREQAATVVREIVMPKLNGVQFVGVDDKIVQANGMSGLVFYRVRIGHDEVAPMAVELQVSDEGPIRRLRSLLNDAWWIEYLRKHKKNSNEASRSEAIREGIVSDRHKLEQLGFSGFVRNDESKPVRSFDDELAQVSGKTGGSRRIELTRDDAGKWRIVKE